MEIWDVWKKIQEMQVNFDQIKSFIEPTIQLTVFCRNDFTSKSEVGEGLMDISI